MSVRRALLPSPLSSLLTARLLGRKSILTPVGSTAVDVHPSWVLALRAPLCSVASNGPCERRIEDMSDRPVFIYAATYASPGDADADYEGLLELHAADLVGTYDVAIINKDVEGKSMSKSTRSRPSTGPGPASASAPWSASSSHRRSSARPPSVA